MKPAPHGSFGQEPSVGVPYHTRSTRPALPAASHGKTFVCKPGTWLDTLIGFVQLAPPSVEGHGGEVLAVVDRAVAARVERRVHNRLARARPKRVVRLAEGDRARRNRGCDRLAVAAGEAVDDDRVVVAVAVTAADEIP